MKKNQQGQRIAIVVLALIILGAAFFIALPNFSLIGGLQGQKFTAYGANFQGNGLYQVGTSLPTSLNSQSECSKYIAGSLGTFGIGGISYSCKWSLSGGITNPEITANINGFAGQSGSVSASASLGNVVAECQAGNLITPSGAGSCPIVQWLSSDGTFNQGWIVQYQTALSLTGSSSGSSNLQLQQIDLILEIASSYWNQAYSLNSTYQGSIYQAPLYAYISNCLTSVNGPNAINTEQCSANNQPAADSVNPMEAGSQIQLYTDPQLAGSLNGLGCSIQGSSGLQSCENTLNSQSSLPSSLLYNGPAYFGETLQNFGTYTCGGTFGIGTGTCSPTLQLTITFYTLLIGSYIPNSVNPVTSTQTVKGGGGNNACNAGQTNLFGTCISESWITFIEIIGTIVVIGIIGVVVLSISIRLPKR